jgi:hypothetical protein
MRVEKTSYATNQTGKDLLTAQQAYYNLRADFEDFVNMPIDGLTREQLNIRENRIQMKGLKLKEAYKIYKEAADDFENLLKKHYGDPNFNE